MQMWSKFHKILKKWSKIQKVESGEPVNEISYQLNVNDYSSYLTFQKAQTVSVKRQKAVVRWLVCIIVLGGAILFRLDQKMAQIILVLSVCIVWLIFSGLFMDGILKRQILRKLKKEGRSYEKIHLSFDDSQIRYESRGREKTYPYELVTHCIQFQRLLILTLKTKEVLIIPKRIFPDKDSWRRFYVSVMENCMQRKTKEERHDQ